MSNLTLDYDDNTKQDFHRVPLDPALQWVVFLHDYQVGHYWDDKEPPKNRDGYNRGYDDHKGRPETVITYEKDEIMRLTPAWVDFCKGLFCTAVYGVADLSMFKPLENAFDNVMGESKVIANHHTFPDGFMSLAFGGNIGKVIGESKPNANFGPAWVLECLDFSAPPPDAERIFFEEQWKWSKATNCRYAKPEDNIDGLANPWQHVNYFPQLDAWGAHVPLPLISRTGTVQVQKTRCKIITNYMIPNPYHPSRKRAYV